MPYRMNPAAGLCAGVLSALAQTGPALAQEIVLDFPSFQQDEFSTAAWWNEVIAAFEAEHPGVTVDFTNSPGGRHTDILATRFAAGSPPDIVHMVSRSFVPFAQQGWFADIAPCFTDDALSQFGGLQSYMEWDGQTQGLLLNSYAFHLFYNRQVLDEAGVTVPTTAEEFVRAVETIDAMNGEAFGFSGVTRADAEAFIQAAIFVTGQGIPWTTESGYNLDSPEMAAVMENFRRVHAEAPRGASEVERNEFFFNGSAAMMFDGNYFWQQALDEADPAVRDAIGIAAAPFAQQPGSVSNSLHIPASLDEERRALVCEFIATAARLDSQEKYGEALSVPPPRDGALTSALRERFPEEMAVMEEAKDRAVSVLPENETVMQSYGLWTKLLADAVVELLATDRETTAVLADLQDRLEREIPLN